MFALRCELNSLILFRRLRLQRANLSLIFFYSFLDVSVNRAKDLRKLTILLASILLILRFVLSKF